MKTCIVFTWILIMLAYLSILGLNSKMEKVLEEISSKQLLNDAVTANLMEF